MGDVEIPDWLKGLPLAPEFRPTDTEFADPIAYISKIEKQASAFGICKIIPPLPKPSKRYVFCNLNKSLSKCPELGSDVNSSNVASVSKMGSVDSGSDGEVRAVFTTRHQELGHSVKRAKGAVNNPQLGVQKQVWQSGEIYTLEQFESKSKALARNLLGMIKEVSPLIIEAMFWRATSEKPIYVEYANDVPGSGFGEPLGQFQYFRRRRRRKRTSYRRSGENSDYNKNAVDSVGDPHVDEIKDAALQNDPKMCLETSNPSTTSSTTLSDEAPRSSRRKSANASNDMEGTAGWKLSNSPWNLQVIARSPGSLTRFMPDDIPGVTSPMVYIGMLFSWFAWHVEDHELHSMNFLHTGSQKTWYAVPGDYAFAFEEVIRAEVYGGNIDRLAALTLLGEKTTLLSPEVVVASGIPCCRLIQNPGEFVVTFPRAYHVGFSHGFNCGEAANFGTPQWLQVAKEAAVRRAAMNYLPMLSHQQLLYLLTMSFVSRVPRSLLPGARSSRLRDRQKEERELLVKRAFIEDMLNENNKLSVLLGRESTYHAVLWDPDLLPFPSKESQLPSVTATVGATPTELISRIHSENNNYNENKLLDEMSLYMETLNDLYLDDDDLSCDFQVDSGTLACVACGILGFPFMSVVQPSERASMELLSADHLLVQEGLGVSEPKNTQPCQDLDGTVKGPVSENLHVHNLSPPSNDLPIPSLTKFEKGWNTASIFLRPRIFCLEHAVQIEELLESKGGANILVICHSDYQKIKAQAAAVAEEIGGPFNYNEVPLDSASPEDLKLIDLAIDDEERNEYGNDWTSKLGINLRYCVKVRKNSPSSQVQHALKLGGLFSEKSSSSEFLNIKWQSRRSRSKIKSNHPSHRKPCESIETKTDEVMGEKLDGIIVRKEEKLIQYSRRNFKLKPKCSAGASMVQGYHRKHLPKEVPAAASGDLHKHSRNTSETNLFNIGNSEGESAGLGFSVSVRISELPHEIQVPEATRDMSLSSPPRNADSLAAAALVVGGVGQTENQEEVNMEGDECNVATCNSSVMQHEIKDTEGTSKKGQNSNSETCSTPHAIAVDKRFEVQQEDQVMENINITNEACDLVSEVGNKILADKDVLMDGVSDLANTASLNVTLLPVGSIDAQMENTIVDKYCMNGEVCDCASSGNEVQQEIQATNRSNDEQLISCDDTLMDQPSSASVKESCQDPRVTCAAGDFCDGVSLEDKGHQEFKITSGITEEPILRSAKINQPTLVSMDESSEIPAEPCAATDLCNVVNLENEVQWQEIQTTNGMKEELVSSSVTQIELDQPTPASLEECSDVPSSKENTCTSVTLDNKVQREIQTTVGTKAEELVSSFVTKIGENQPNPVSAEACSEVPRGSCAKESSSGDVTRDSDMQEKDLAKNASNKEGPHSRHVTPRNQPTPAPIQECPRTQRETCIIENLRNGSEVCSSQDNRELESIDCTMIDPRSNAGKGRKRKREVEQETEDKFFDGFIRSPCEGLRPRAGKDATTRNGNDIRKMAKEKQATKKVVQASNVSVTHRDKKEIAKGSHKCDLEGCRMRFETKAELLLHKRNQCPHEGCRKKFRSHKYAMLHQRVHDDERPLKCPWKGCSMSFKWAWARTEHIRVHTGERPYQCKVEGCGLSFRFVSDFSRHRRKTGHYVNSPT